MQQSRLYLITGAGKGIGFATTQALLQAGHRVVACSRSLEALLSMQNEVDSDVLMVHALDLSEAQAVDAFVERLSEPLDGVINNAGLLINKSFEELTDSDWQDQWEVNVMGPVRLLRALKKANKLSQGAHILNISSMGGYQGSSKFPGLSAYSSTKGALNTFTECLATEWASNGISVNSLCLGAVNTEMLQAAFPGFEPPVSAKEMGEYIAHFITQPVKLISGKVLAIAAQDPA